MAFLGVYKAIYDYTPQSEGELQINEGDLLYVLEKSEDDDWWKAKKKASVEDEDEPVGLIPNNYIEEVSMVQNRITLCYGMIVAKARSDCCYHRHHPLAKPAHFTSTRDRRTKSCPSPRMLRSMSTTRQTLTGSLLGLTATMALFLPTI